MTGAETGISIFTFVFVFVELLGIAAALHAIMSARTSQGAIAWGISLVAFPWFALIAYAVFGRSKFNGYASLRHLKDEKIHHVIEQCRTEAFQGLLTVLVLSGSQKVLTRLADMPVTRYNKSLLLIDGEETFDMIFQAIDGAKDYILLEFYIVRDDPLGRELKDRLIQKVRENVRVYFLYDEIGSYKLPGHYIQSLQRAGIETRAFHTTKGKANHFQLNFRNHRKIVVVDGRSAFVGGHNVGDEYRSRHPGFGRWRDTHLMVVGPVVQAIQYCFVEDWYWAASAIPQVSWNLHRAPDGAEDALVIASGPADDLETCALMFTQLINSARERLWIASPYFVPDRQILGALKLAALRGVDVRILLPEKPDNLTVHLASFSFYPSILSLGIKLYRYTGGFMHQKVLLVDSFCAAIGTANLDNRSFRLNFELMLLNFTPSFIAQVESMLLRDFSHSRVVTLEEYSRRWFAFKVAVRFASLLSPIL